MTSLQVNLHLSCYDSTALQVGSMLNCQEENHESTHPNTTAKTTLGTLIRADSKAVTF